MMRLSTICVGLLLAALSVSAEPVINLVPDCSFESPLPLWFEPIWHEQKGSRTCAYSKAERDDAPDGRTVMSVQGWQAKGSWILSPAIEISASTVSVSAMMRASGSRGAMSCELALYDARDNTLITSIATVEPDEENAWRRLEKRGIEIPASAKTVRLGIVPRGDNHNGIIELDLLGLFEGNTIPLLEDNDSFTFIEAEDLADGDAWKVKEHYPYWYLGTPSNDKMLAGSHPSKQYRPLTKSLQIKHSGKYKLWVRYLALTTKSWSSTFNYSLRQKGALVANTEVSTLLQNKTSQTQNHWEWASITAELEAGTVDIVLERPRISSSGHSRNIDCFLLTNQLDYQADITTLRPAGYMRFVNLSEQQEPFCLYILVKRAQKPLFRKPGLLSKAGTSRFYNVPSDKSQFLAFGDASPWVRITDDLLDLGLNNVSLVATRINHSKGFVQGPIKGRMEFSVGRSKKIVKTITVDQDAPQIWLTLPSDLENRTDEIRDPWFYIKEKQAVIDRIELPTTKRCKHLDIGTGLSLNSLKDDTKVIEAEFNILRQLGFNNIDTWVFPADKMLEAFKRYGFKQEYRLSAWEPFKKRIEGSMYHPDIAAIEAIMKHYATAYKDQAKYFARTDLMDEPGGMSYGSLIESNLCQDKFREVLKQEGYDPGSLGVANWDHVRLVGPEEKEKQPILFYHTGIFRLKALPFFLRAITAAKNKYLPKAGATYANLSPTSNCGSWAIKGTDPFFLHRDALEMPWSEDWLGYGAGAQHISDRYAVLRAARDEGAPPPSGYVIGADASQPHMIRMKLYANVAAGVRKIDIFRYGPYYSNNGDNWSRRLSMYEDLSKVLHEFAVIDEALHGSTRMKTDIALLYNRTSGIWADPNFTSEHNDWYVHWALAHGGYDADFIPEEDIESGDLDKYKVLYMGGVQLRRECAQKIADWVSRGGVLVGSAGSGTCDEYNQPMNVLDYVFGVKSIDCQLVKNVGRPSYELRTQNPLNTIRTTGKGTPEVEFDQLCYAETLEASSEATVIARTADDGCAGVKNAFGKGTAIRLAAMPGISYLNEAVRGKDYDITSYLPTQFRQSLRDFIVWPAALAGARRVAETDEPITEIVRYDGEDRAVVFIIDHDAARKESITVALHNAAQFTKAYTASGSDVRIAPGEGNALTVRLPMYVADAIVLQK